MNGTNIALLASLLASVLSWTTTGHSMWPQVLLSPSGQTCTPRQHLEPTSTNSETGLILRSGELTPEAHVVAFVLLQEVVDVCEELGLGLALQR